MSHLDIQPASTARPPLDASTTSKTENNTIAASPALKAQEFHEKSPGDTVSIHENVTDEEKGATAPKSTVNEADLIKGKTLAVVWCGFLL